MFLHMLQYTIAGLHPQYPARFAVPDDKVDFAAPFAEYAPVDFTHKAVVDNDETKKRGGWADPMDLAQVRNIATRLSHEAHHFVLDPATGAPLNPHGRTGMVGRGLLGKWGPNHAADPIVTRMWDGRVQMVAIKRKDTGTWAIPGGMVDPGESVSQTVRREFEEEAGNLPAEELEAFRHDLNQLFATGKVVYKGYVDDPRNTDNAWMETVVMHFRCTASLGERLRLNAGDDAAAVKCLDVDEANADFANLYASHKSFVNLCVADARVVAATPTGGHESRTVAIPAASEGGGGGSPIAAAAAAATAAPAGTVLEPFNDNAVSRKLYAGFVSASGHAAAAAAPAPAAADEPATAAAAGPAEEAFDIRKMAHAIERQLEQRTDEDLLVQRHVLLAPHDGTISPALLSTKESLEREKVADTLERRLEMRPPEGYLLERNIIHETHDGVSPSLQATRDELEKQRLRDMLERKIEQRVEESALIDHNILHHPHDGPSGPIQAAMDAVEREKLVDHLEKRLGERESEDTLLNRNILHASHEVAPALVAAKDELERERLAQSLEKKLEKALASKLMQAETDGGDGDGDEDDEDATGQGARAADTLDAAAAAAADAVEEPQDRRVFTSEERRAVEEEVVRNAAEGVREIDFATIIAIREGGGAASVEDSPAPPAKEAVVESADGAAVVPVVAVVPSNVSHCAG
jgi:ADP-ribose pyrophosphatase